MRWIGKPAILVAVILSGLGLTASPRASAQEKPNIVMLMTDDTGWSACFSRAA